MDSREIEVLQDLMTIMQEVGLPMLLVGAGARILVFDRRFGEGRRTNDLDIALSIESWETYRNLALRLTADPAALFRSSNIPHRFTHVATEIEVDIVPFGKIGEPDQEIQWPESGNLMSVMGFTEALRHAKIEIVNGLESLW
jgi:predicted nucleotidyltransferase